MSTHVVDEGDVIWKPAPDARQTTKIGRYMDWLETEHGLEFANYDELWQWSVDDLDAFWRTIWDYFDIQSATPVGDTLGRREMPGAEWFPGTQVNYAGQILRKLRERPEDTAIIGVSQTRDDIELSNADLIDLIGRISNGLKELGIAKGDRVVAYMPNLPETVAAHFACASLGIIWASAAPEFGPQAVIDRFGQLEPTVLLTVDGYHYGNKDIDTRDRVAAIQAGIPSIEHTIALSYNGREVPNTTPWAEFTSEPGDPEVVPVPFDHPLCVLFSSGTTGLPKAIVHGHGGLMIESLKNHTLGWDLGPGDRLMWFSTTAWMMWNALVSTLLTGASIVCIDGNPIYPDQNAQWKIAERTRPTMMGLGPAFIIGCQKQKLEPTKDFDLSSIRALAAAGSPLSVEGFVWLDEQFGRQAPLSVGSGGTDVCTGIVQGYPIVPVYAGEMSTKCLGVSVYAYDEEGNSVIGELGELVITKPMPTMPLKFWGDDEDMSRYKAAYFEHYEGVMRFGDWVRFHERGSSAITGRSDATLNRGGVRIGSAEIYRVVEQHLDIADCMIVHLEDNVGGMGELVLFVVSPERDVDEDFKRELVGLIRSSLSPRHAPDVVMAMPAVPRNMTGKKLELPVKKILLGAAPDSVVSRQAMADPDSLDPYIEFAASRA